MRPPRPYYQAVLAFSSTVKGIVEELLDYMDMPGDAKQDVRKRLDAAFEELDDETGTEFCEEP